MDENITLEDLSYFYEKYNEKKENLIIADKIRKYGIKKACVNEENNYEFNFNIEVPEVKIYNQHHSHQCNIYAFLRVVKDILRNNTDLDVNNIDISANYIAFFDKLEKVNVLLNELIKKNNLTLEIINNAVNRYIGSYGTFHFCREIVNKYGLILSKGMKEVNSKYDEFLTIELLKDKIKIDLIELINSNDKKNVKRKILNSTYEFLSKIYGNPPKNFIFNNKQISPIEFKNLYLKDTLENFVTVTSVDKESLFASYSYIPNVYLNDKEKIVKLSNEKIKKVIINQLKDNISIWFSSEESKTLDYDNGLLDDKVYKFKDLLSIKNTSKKNKLELDIINYDHAMCITGALIENDEIMQYKVDNSFGSVGKYNGYLIMTPSFLENDVITLIIDKKYMEGIK